APALAHRQPFLAIEPVQLLAVHHDALPAQQQVQPPIAKTPALGRQILQSLPQHDVVRSLGGIAVGLRLKPHQPAGPPLRIALLLDRPAHSQSSHPGRQKFFPSISFSLRFSSSSAFSRRASDTSIPPYRERHL